MRKMSRVPGIEPESYRRRRLGCWIESNCPHMGAGPIGVVPSVGWGVFLRDPNPYLREFRRKPHKTPNDKVYKLNRELNPSTRFERRATQPLVGPKLIMKKDQIVSFLFCMPL